MAVYRMAGVTVKMDARFPLTHDRAEAYRVDTDAVDMTLVGGGADAYEEHAVLARSFYEQLPRFDGFLLHASAVELGGRAFAFSAKSGTGKSTHAAHWCRELGALIVNDDKPAVRRIHGTFCACGTPFSGKHDASRAVCVPLGGVVLLKRGEQNAVRRLETNEALWMLLNQTLRPKEKTAYAALLSLFEELIAAVPFYEVHCVDAPQAAHDIYQGILQLEGEANGV